MSDTQFGLARLKVEGSYTDEITGRPLTSEEIAAYERQCAQQVALHKQFARAQRKRPAVISADWLTAQVMMAGHFDSASDRQQAMQHLSGLVLRRIADGRIRDAATCANLVAPQQEQDFSWGW
jgi:hypothetical protein